MSIVRGLGTHARALRACLAILLASVAARGAPGHAESAPRGDPRQEPRAPAGLETCLPEIHTTSDSALLVLWAGVIGGSGSIIAQILVRQTVA